MAHTAILLFSQAGHAGPALKSQLKDYEDLRKKAKASLMPTEVDPPALLSVARLRTGLSDLWEEGVLRKKRSQLAKSLRKDVSLYLLTERAYLATRRG